MFFFFIFTFILFFIFESQLEIITKFVNDEKFINFVWRVRNCIFGTYIIFVVDYVYIYLKRNNFKQINSLKNSFCNIFITFLIFIILWGMLLVPIYIQRDLIQTYELYYYQVVLYIFFIMITFNLISLFILSFISENKKENFNQKSNFFYVFLIAVIVLSLILFFWLEMILGLENYETMKDFKIILEIFIILDLILFLANIFERIILRKSKNNI